MKNFFLKGFLIIQLSNLFFCSSFAQENICPKESAHCIYADSNVLDSKWIKIEMRPRNIILTLCLKNKMPVYLERDDIETDNLSPGMTLSWTIRQCLHEDCQESLFLAQDNFLLLFEKNHYKTIPSHYIFAFEPAYGDAC